jgi:O-antigen ligase
VAHNSFLSVLVEHGIVGFLFYMGMFVAVVVSVLRLPLLERRFALVLLATLGVAMFPLTWEDRRPVWFVLAVLLGLSQTRIAARPAGRPAPATGLTPAVGRRRGGAIPARPTAPERGGTEGVRA